MLPCWHSVFLDRTPLYICQVLQPLEDPSLVEASLVSGYFAGPAIVLIAMRSDFVYPRRDCTIRAEPMSVRRSVAVTGGLICFALNFCQAQVLGRPSRAWFSLAHVFAIRVVRAANIEQRIRVGKVTTGRAASTIAEHGARFCRLPRSK